MSDNIKARIFRDPSGLGYRALLSYRNGARVDVEAPTFLKLKNLLKSLGLHVDIYEFELPDGMGFLERTVW